MALANGIQNLETTAKLLQLPFSVARKFLGAIDQEPGDPLTTMTAEHRLAFATGAWLFSVLSLHPDTAAGLLLGMKEFLQNIAADMDVAADNAQSTTVPQHQLHIVDNRYAVWGDCEEFWDLHTSKRLNPLPSPPVWRTTVLLYGLYVRFQQAINKERTDANQQPEHDQAAS